MIYIHIHIYTHTYLYKRLRNLFRANVFLLFLFVSLPLFEMHTYFRHAFSTIKHQPISQQRSQNYAYQLPLNH